MSKTYVDMGKNNMDYKTLLNPMMLKSDLFEMYDLDYIKMKYLSGPFKVPIAHAFTGPIDDASAIQPEFKTVYDCVVSCDPSAPQPLHPVHPLQVPRITNYKELWAALLLGKTVFVCAPHDSWLYNEANRIRQDMIRRAKYTFSTAVNWEFLHKYDSLVYVPSKGRIIFKCWHPANVYYDSVPYWFHGVDWYGGMILE